MRQRKGSWKNRIKRCVACVCAMLLITGTGMWEACAQEASDTAVSAQDGLAEVWDGLNPEDTVLIAGKEEVSLRKAYFLVKFQQSIVHSMQKSMYGSEWYSLPIYEGDRSFQDNIKDGTINLLERMSLARAHMEELGVTVSKEEQQKIDDAVELFFQSNSEEALEAMMADQETVTEILQDYLILSKVITKLTKDTKVDYKNARTYSYIYGAFQESVDSALQELDEDSESMLEDFRSIRQAVQSGTDFDTAAAQKGYPSALHTYYIEDDGDKLAEFNEVMQELKEGEVSKVTVTKSRSGIFLGCVQKLDEEGLEDARASLLKTQQAKELRARMNEWMETMPMQVDDAVWNEVTLKRAITAYVAENEES